MRILIIGQGGREHALAWVLARSPQAPDLFIAPGNPGTAEVGTNVPIAATDVPALLHWAQEHAIDFTVVGPEQPLVAGLVDTFEAAGQRVVGPTAAAARLEGSKAFAKQFMAAHGIPTANHRTFQADEYDAAVAYVRQEGAPIVIKASGLAGGKGAVVCHTLDEALEAVTDMMQGGTFGDAGAEVVVESFMEGEEVSVFVLTDGAHYLLLAPAQDHKRAYDGDEGPNTGGMGAYAPAPLATGRLLTQVCRDVIEPTLGGMVAAGHPYRGILYVGLMVTETGPRVVEYNCRLGDPEAQVVLPLVQSDLVEVFDALSRHRLREVSLIVDPGAAACVVLASGGYPGAYEKGHPIEGLDAAAAVPGATVFQAGTGHDDTGRLCTAGGRVLGVSAQGADLAEALSRAYEAADRITFNGKHARRDIGRRGLERLSATP
ncbi:MAG: phosphoribosylamine--glycine ligase [Bacteroidota bacterium]